VVVNIGVRVAAKIGEGLEVGGQQFNESERVMLIAILFSHLSRC
jgi:hypothetical protein